MRILYLDLDTLRPDHLGCYGYHRNTSPNIDKIASEGIKLNNCHCSDAPCLPSRTAMMTGKFGIHTGVVNHGGVASEMRYQGPNRRFKSEHGNMSALPKFLNRAGLHTVLVSPFAERHSTWHYYAGFREMYNTGKSGSEIAKDVTPTVLKWIKDNADKDNWYLHVNYWDAHTTYRTPEEFGNPFENEPLPDWMTEEILEKHKKKTGPHSALDFHMYNGDKDPKCPRDPGCIQNMNDFRMAVDGYDCGIAYMDSHIGKLLDAFEKKGVLDDMVIIVSADHAENMGELGIYGEHATADYINTRIPMIIRWPGQIPNELHGQACDGLHYNLDLAPTFADMLGLDPHPTWDGKSFGPTIREGKNVGHDYLVVSQCAHTCQRGVRFGDWMYIRTYHDGLHVEFPKEMLFNVKDDPHEMINVAKQNEDVCLKAVYKLNEWHDDMMMSMDIYDNDPMWTVIREGGPWHARVANLPEYCERLEETGRSDGAEIIKERYPKHYAKGKLVE